MASLTYQFRSHSIVAFYKRSGKSTFRTEAKKRSIENLAKQETYTGMVTHGSQKRLTKAIEILLQVAEPKKMTFDGREYWFKVNFITLTLYSFNRRVPGKEAHKNCLEPLLLWLRRKHGMKAYVWKAELQSNRDDCHQLHYHLTTDCYVDKYELRDKWNELQRKAGYLDYYFEKYGHWNANSTDVHATHKKRNLVGYLKKAIVRYSDKKKYQHLRSKHSKPNIIAEMAKNDQNNETIEGKVWDCSINIKTSYYEVKDFADVTRRIAQAVVIGEMDRKEFDKCTIYELKKTNRMAGDYLPWIERQFYNEHLRKIREFERIKPDIHTFSSS